MSLNLITALFFATGCAYGIQFGEWKTLPGLLTHVTAGKKGVWGVNRQGNLYRLDGNNWTQLGTGGWWTVSSGGRNIWATRKDHTIRRGDGKDWQTIPGGLVQIESSEGDNTWAVNVNHDIYRYNGMNWQHIPGKLAQISSGEAGVWGVNSGGWSYYRPNTYGDNPTTGGNWQRVSSSPQMRWIASGTGVVVGVAKDGNLYYRSGISVASPNGSSWVKVTNVSSMKQVDIFQSMIIGVDTNDQIKYSLIR